MSTEKYDGTVDLEQLAVNLPLARLDSIARKVRQDWVRINYGAKPYLDVMSTLGSVDDQYGFDSGKSIVRYFLSNASTWRGPVARLVKAELNRRIK